MDDEKLAMQRRIDTLDQHAVKLHAALTEYERENARLKADLEIAKIQNQYISEVASAYEKDIEKLERERDAAVKDVAIIKFCHACKHDKNSVDESDICWSCVNKCYWEWRGVQENGGIDA